MTIAHLLWWFYAFKGRMGRQHYWIGLCVLIAVAFLAYFPYSFLWGLYGRSVVVTAYVVFTFFFLLGWPGLALGVKRLHDRNRSGWWFLLFVWLPGVLDKVNDKLQDESPLWWMTLLASAGLGLWGLIELGFLRGTPGGNVFGEPQAEASK